ncbi:MAG: sulfatase, partial [Candidatus Hydrogenedentes bacterium]|nr:sulfatase [Candidatus Hydrogenedentota bacterium]
GLAASIMAANHDGSEGGSMARVSRRGFMKATVAGGLAALLAQAEPRAHAAAAAGRRPNIILVLVDDLGWADLGCWGNTFNETPNLDRLAREGVRFTDAYSAAPVCSPTRASIMTGQYPWRVGITNYLRGDDTNYLSPEVHYALPKALGDSGYATGIIGKWHLMGDYAKRKGDPKLHGFQEAICSESSYIGGGDYFHPYNHLADVPAREEGEFLPDRLGKEAVDFIERHAGEPFFLELSFYSVHTRLDAPKDLVAKYQAKPEADPHTNNPILGAMLERVDAALGGIVQTIRDKGLEENTWIVFMSDNGGEHNVTSNAPLRGAKSELYEGGIRVPMIVWAPGRAQAGLTCDVPVNTVDFYPSFLDAANVPLPESRVMDGVSFLPLLQAGGAIPDRPLYWHYPLDKPHFLGGRSSGAIRVGDYKLIHFYDTGQRELYNLAKDLGESRNLAGRQAGLAASLQRQLSDWIVQTRNPPVG